MSGKIKVKNEERYIKKEIELKSDNVNLETGEIKGLSSVFDDVDQVGDVLLPGSFTKTLNEGGADRPLLWQHNPSEPIGTATHTQTSKALELGGLISKEVQRGRETLALLKLKSIKGISIGFEILQDKILNNKGHRGIAETKLWESSIVTFPCLLSAQVTAVKQMRVLSSKDFSAYLDGVAMSGKSDEEIVKELKEYKVKMDAIIYSMSEETESALFGNSDYDLDDKQSATLEKNNSDVEALLSMVNIIKGN